MAGDPGGFLTCDYQGLCIHPDESRVDPSATAWFGEDISATVGDPQLHQAADGLAFLAVKSRTSCVRMMEERAPLSLQPLTSYISVNG